MTTIRALFLTMAAPALLLTSACVFPAWSDTPGPALSVDVEAKRHPINPHIYGMAYADPALAREIHLPINRWGGDATTRYNWQVAAMTGFSWPVKSPIRSPARNRTRS